MKPQFEPPMKQPPALTQLQVPVSAQNQFWIRTVGLGPIVGLAQVLEPEPVLAWEQRKLRQLRWASCPQRALRTEGLLQVHSLAPQVFLQFSIKPLLRW